MNKIRRPEARKLEILLQGSKRLSENDYELERFSINSTFL